VATFYRRLQTNAVMWGVRISLIDLVFTVFFSICGWIGTAKLLTLYEINCMGSSFFPSGVALVIFIKVCGWFRREGDGVINKDGRFRYLSSHKINRILIPDTYKAEELFVVVRDVFQVGQQSWFASALARLTGNFDLKQPDAGAQRIAGTSFCTKLKRSD
jgi:hypothetical protein